MKDNQNSIPTPEQVRLIFKDTYNLYVKYKNCWDDKEWVDFVKEIHQLYQIHSFELCKIILVELLDITEKSYINKKKLLSQDK